MKAGWQMKRLGDLSDLITKGTTPTSVGFDFAPQGVNFIKVESISESGQFIDSKVASITNECHDALRRSQMQEGDILFSIAGALGRTAMVPKSILPANTNQALAIIRLKKSDQVLPSFVLKTLGTGFVLEQIEKSRGGVAQQNLSLAQVRDFVIPLPSLPEQHRIVAILDEAFAGIATATANAERNLNNARELFKSHLQSVFTCDEAGWQTKQLGDICQTGSGGTPLKSTKEFYEGGTIPWIVSGEVSQGEVTSAKHFITKNGLENSSARLFPKNTILVAMYGATAGETGILRFEASTNQAVCGILPNKYFVPEFLYYCMLSKKEELISQAVGNAQPNISQIKIRNTEVPIPPLPEQHRIVTILDSLSTTTNRMETIYQQKHTALNELKQSLLHQAFSGQLH